MPDSRFTHLVPNQSRDLTKSSTSRFTHLIPSQPRDSIEPSASRFADLVPNYPKGSTKFGADKFMGLSDAPVTGKLDERAGFVERFTKDPLKKMAFSGAGVAKTISLAQASKRIQADDYETTVARIDAAGRGGLLDQFKQPLTYPLPPAGKKHTAESLKEADTKLLNDYFERAAEEQRRGITLGGKVGDILSNMPGYAIEFLATGGLSKLTSKAAQEVGEKILKESAKKGLGKAVVGISKFAASAGARATAMPHRGAEAILKRQLPEGININNLGEAEIIKPDEKVWTSIWKGSLDHYIEIASEQAGEFMGPAVNKIVGKLPFMGKFMGALQRSWLNKFTNKSATDFLKKVGTKTGFHGVLSEVGEEDLGWIARAIFNVEDYGAGPDANMGERLKAGLVQDIKNLLPELIAFMIPGVASRGVSQLLPEETPPIEPTPTALGKTIDEAAKPQEYQVIEYDVSGKEKGPVQETFATKEEAQAYAETMTESSFTPGMFEVRAAAKPVEGKPFITEEISPKKEGGQFTIQAKVSDKPRSQVIGSITYTLDKDKDIIYISDTEEMFVAEKHRRKGIATALIDKLRQTHPGMKIDFGPTTEEGQAFIRSLALAEQVKGLEKLAEERGLKPEIAPEERKFKEPTITHHLTPQLYEAEKLGVKFMTKPAEIGKQRLDVEFNRHVRDLDKTERIINKLGGETVRSRAAAKLKNKPTKSVERFTELLNTHEEAPASLSDKEKAVFNYFRNLSRSLIARENEVRKKLGMKPIIYKLGYVRHIVDKLAEDIIDGRHPIPEDLKFWAEENVKAKIHNPMEFQRKLGDELEDIFSKDLIGLSKAMMWTGLREVHLTEPLKFFESQLALHSEVIPSTTRRWTEKFINHMIKGQPTDLDKSLDALVTKSGLNGIFNKILKPFGRIVSNRPLTNLMQKTGRLQIYGVMGWRPKQLIRNKFQLVQNLALYTVKANLKGFLPANKQLKGLMSESLFLESYRGFEDLTAIDKKTLGRYWLAPFQWTAVSNARQAMKVAYWDTLDLIENKKYKDLGWADSKRTYKEKPGFLYESEKAKIINEMEFGAGVTQYHYIPMAMPEVFRHKALIPFTRLQSWWMNHFFKFHAESATRFFKGETSYGAKLPWSRRIGWGRYMVIGGIILNTLGYTRSYLLGAAPDSFPPIGKLLAYAYLWLKAMATGNVRTRESAGRKFREAAKTFIPGYLAIKDVKAVMSGEKGPIHLFFYGKQKERERGRKRKRPARKTRRRR